MSSSKSIKILLSEPPSNRKLPQNPPTMKRGPLLRILLHNFIFCTAIALVLWLFVPSIGQYGLFSNFVHAQAIGTSITLLAIALTRWANAAGLSFFWSNVFSIGVATVLGVLFGLWLAALLLGHNTNPLAFILDSDELLVSAITAVVASLAFNWHLHRRENFMRLELLASEERRRADAANHAMLRAQLEPHMLFNTLANLRALIGTDSKQAINMLDHLDRFLRSTLKSSKSSYHPLSTELNVLQDYLALMKIRMADRLQYSFTLPDECKDFQVPALILQPLVENAIRHGLEPKIEGGQIGIEARVENGTLVLMVEDSGIGIATDSAHTRGPANQIPLNIDSACIDNAQGFGLENIRQRLQQIYADDAALTITEASSPTGNTGTGTCATITLPIQADQDAR